MKLILFENQIKSRQRRLAVGGLLTRQSSITSNSVLSSLRLVSPVSVCLLIFIEYKIITLFISLKIKKEFYHEKLEKYAFASASVVALAAGPLLGKPSGNNKKAADSASGEKPVIKMYQIGDKPDNLDELLENANKIIGKEVGAKLDIQYIGWGDYVKKMTVITSSGENYDIAFALTMS